MGGRTRLIGIVPADLTDIGETVETGPAKGYRFLTIARYAAAYPDLELSSILTLGGEAALGIVGERCAEDVLARFADTDTPSCCSHPARPTSGAPC